MLRTTNNFACFAFLSGRSEEKVTLYESAEKWYILSINTNIELYLKFTWNKKSKDIYKLLLSSHSSKFFWLTSLMANLVISKFPFALSVHQFLLCSPFLKGSLIDIPLNTKTDLKWRWKRKKMNFFSMLMLGTSIFIQRYFKNA